MIRWIGISLLFIGLAGPTILSVCNFECHSMQSPPESGSYIDEAALPCCIGGETAITTQVSVRPLAKYRNVVRLQVNTAADLLFEHVSFSSSPLPRDGNVAPPPNHSSSILRI